MIGAETCFLLNIEITSYITIFHPFPTQYNRLAERPADTVVRTDPATPFARLVGQSAAAEALRRPTAHSAFLRKPIGPTTCDAILSIRPSTLMNTRHIVHNRGTEYIIYFQLSLCECPCTISTST